jgi:hypothetical protein
MPGNAGNRVSPTGIVEKKQRIFMDRLAWRADPGRIDAAQNRQVLNRHFTFNADQTSVAASKRQGV